MFEDAVKQQVLSSALRLRTASSTLTRDFYARLFTSAPELRAMFPEDLRPQAEKLFDMILVLVQSLDHLQMLVTELEALGAAPRVGGQGGARRRADEKNILQMTCVRACACVGAGRTPGV